jgi:hypothetical protein
MVNPVASGPLAPPTRPGAAAPAVASETLSFDELLSSLNPLQYIPVVGTLYRAITGDRANEGVRDAGSLVLSAVMGGPFGVVANFATTLVEKLTGYGPEWLGGQVVAELGLNLKASPNDATATSAPVVATAPHVAAAVVAEAPSAPVAAQPATAIPLTPAQLAAYGVRQGHDGSLAMGTLQGADVLNAIELSRHDTAAAVAAYGRPTVPALANAAKTEGAEAVDLAVFATAPKAISN